ERSGDFLVVQALVAQLAGPGPEAVLGVGSAGPLRRGFAPEGVVQRGIAHRTQGFPDLAQRLALAAQQNGLLSQVIEFLPGAHIRTLARTTDIPPDRGGGGDAGPA